MLCLRNTCWVQEEHNTQQNEPQTSNTSETLSRENDITSRRGKELDSSSTYQCRFGVDFRLDVESESSDDSGTETQSGNATPVMIPDSRIIVVQPGTTACLELSRLSVANAAVSDMVRVDM